MFWRLNYFEQTDATISGIGFNTSYRVSPCGGDVTSPQTIATPNFPAYYGLNVDCVWLIDLSENGQQVQVTFDELQLDSSDCTQDYLRILNGHMSTSPQLGRYCGSTRPNVIRSQSSFLWIHFHSDNIAGNSKGVSFTVDAFTSGNKKSIRKQQPLQFREMSWNIFRLRRNYAQSDRSYNKSQLPFGLRRRQRMRMGNSGRSRLQNNSRFLPAVRPGEQYQLSKRLCRGNGVYHAALLTKPDDWIWRFCDSRQVIRLEKRNVDQSGSFLW